MEVKNKPKPKRKPNGSLKATKEQYAKFTQALESCEQVDEKKIQKIAEKLSTLKRK